MHWLLRLKCSCILVPEPDHTCVSVCINKDFVLTVTESQLESAQHNNY